MFNCGDFSLVPLVKEDAESLSEMMVSNSERFQDYFPKTLEENVSVAKSKQFIRTISEDFKNRKQFLFALKTENTIAGLIYIKELDWEKKEGEFAYCISKAYSGRGFISKGVAKLSEYAFDALHLETVNIITHKSNTPSVRIAKKCGFHFVKTLKNEFTPPGKEPLDMELYQLKR